MSIVSFFTIYVGTSGGYATKIKIVLAPDPLHDAHL